MTERTEEQIARDKAAVDAMRNAKSNMDAALARIATLESALATARDDLGRAKGFISPSVYTYGGQKTVHESINDSIASAAKALG